jgi:polyisoprenoid-binding protein YceI
VSVRHRIDAARSAVWIDATSSVHPIHTKATGLDGYVTLTMGGDGAVDVTAPVAGHLSLPVSRLRSPNPLEDRELKRRIDAKRFPTIDGELRSIRPADGPAGRYVVAGDLTFRGVTVVCEDELTIGRDDDGAVHLAGSSVFDVRDFGMEPPRILVLRVHPEVRVRVELVAVPEG